VIPAEMNFQKAGITDAGYKNSHERAATIRIARRDHIPLPAALSLLLEPDGLL